MSGHMTVGTAVMSRHADIIPQWDKLLVGFAPLVFLVGFFLRPDTVIDNRVGIAILDEVIACDSWGEFQALDFYSQFYAVVKWLVPFRMGVMEAWDILIAAAGLCLLMALLFGRVGSGNIGMSEAVFLLAATGLSSIYIFMLNKDFLQFLIFLLVAAVVGARLPNWVRLALATAIFVAEYFLWRKYYLIVAAFSILFYLGFGLMGGERWSSWNVRKKALASVCVFLISLLVFAYVLRALSFEDYKTIVGQHGADREDYTATNAASGIASLLDVTAYSQPYLFAANWMINAVRLLFPVELFAKSPYYWVFAAYQLYLTYRVVRSAAAGGGGFHLPSIWRSCLHLPLSSRISGRGCVMRRRHFPSFSLSWVKPSKEPLRIGSDFIPSTRGWLAHESADKKFVKPFGEGPCRLQSIIAGVGRRVQATSC